MIGRMYITDKFICFYSNLFGMEKKIRIPYGHITLITKEKTALVIPNAIAITTYRKEYIFRSFWDRDECFEMLKAFIKKFKGVSGGASTTSTAVADARPVSTKAPAEGVAKEVGDPNRARKESVVDVDEVDSEIGAQNNSSASVANIQAAFDDDCNKSKLKLTILSGETVATSMKNFIERFIDDSASYPLNKHHEILGDQNMSLNKWSSPVAVTAENLNSVLVSDRDMKFMKIVNLPGLKQTRGVKIQKLKRYGDKGMILQTSTRLDDVPMADAFSVEDVIVVRATDANTVQLDVYLEVKFLKYTMLKSVIESNTNSEVTKWLQDYVAALKTALKSNAVSPSNNSSNDPAPSAAVIAADTALFTDECSKNKLKVVAFTNEIINIGLKDFVAAFVEDNSPYGLVK